MRVLRLFVSLQCAVDGLVGLTCSQWMKSNKADPPVIWPTFFCSLAVPSPECVVFHTTRAELEPFRVTDTGTNVEEFSEETHSWALPRYIVCMESIANRSHVSPMVSSNKAHRCLTRGSLVVSPTKGA